MYVYSSQILTEAFYPQNGSFICDKYDPVGQDKCSKIFQLSQQDCTVFMVARK